MLHAGSAEAVTSCQQEEQTLMDAAFILEKGNCENQLDEEGHSSSNTSRWQILPNIGHFCAGNGLGSLFIPAEK